MQTGRALSLKDYLEETIEREAPNLRALTDERSALSPGNTAAWSPREELGHLIDSATNNHVRFARAAIEGSFRGPVYAQDDWVRIHRYRDTAWFLLVDCWLQYNRVLCNLVGNIPEERLSAECTVGSNAPVTLHFLIDDYVLHMKHHLDHILARYPITQYPRSAQSV